ncbi:alpha DNA polymerase [Coprinopsis marcescibilis]|uniref:DNA polymerase alpha subunit B n=1 Tax=Coprinopsis marcescibilis TaxID=230819 RepID=A0A5C3KK51_COPMA|nr:alpha DNA polymerase [Coprinopsis marcescibilis]
MDSKLREKIVENYSELVTSDEAIVNDLMSICTTYNLDPVDLRYKLEAMNYKSTNTRTEILPITLDTLKAFKAQMRRDMTRESTKKVQVKARVAAVTASVDRSKLPNQLMNQGRAMDVDYSEPTSSGLPARQFKKEPLAGGITLSTGPTHVVFEGAKNDVQSRKRRGYRYMYEKISERSQVLDQVIDDFAELIKEHYEIEELADPSSTTDEEVTIVGRITLDTEVSSLSKLSEASLVIESSRMLSSGARVPLRLEPAIRIRGAVRGTRNHGFFPGQIVALQGKNGGGGYFLATTILSIPPLKPSPASLGISNPKADPSLGEKPTSVCIASGPYTSDTDLLYKPWRTFLESVTSRKPHALILIGPFIDSAHPRIRNGESDTLPSSIFQARFMNPIRKFLTVSPSSIVVLIPCVRDMISDHCVFPQKEFSSEITGGDPRIIVQPNPARFLINDISFAVTSVDTIYHLRKDECLKLGTEHQPLVPKEGELASDGMGNLCRQMLNQRSFYPVFPVPEELSHEINLDVSHLDDARMVDDGDIDYAPDVLIVPSRFKRFDKIVSTTLAINPSAVSKGCYALVNIGSKSETPNLRERIKAELVHDAHMIQVPQLQPVAVVKAESAV